MGVSPSTRGESTTVASSHFPHYPSGTEGTGEPNLPLGDGPSATVVHGEHPLSVTLR